MKHLNYLLNSIILFSILLTGCEKEETKPVAVFSMDKMSIEVNETIAFTNFSENATSYLWDFGDGNSSTNEHPTHSYSSKGTYTVTLTAIGNGGQDTNVQTLEVIATLSGSWNTTFNLYGEGYNGTYEIIQGYDNSLSGSFIFSDGSGYTNIDSSSNIDGNDVTIVWSLGAYELTFIGNVNDAFNYISGNFYCFSIDTDALGDWSASKSSKISAVIKSENIVNSHMQQFLNSLEK